MRCFTSLFLIALSLPSALALPASESPTPTTTMASLPPYQRRQQPPPTINPTEAIFREQPGPEASQGPIAAEDDGVLGVPPPPPPLPPIPVVTMAPNHNEALASKGYTQVTYYSCRTVHDGGAEQCGWHMPLRKVEGAAAGGAKADARVVAAVVGAAAGVFAMGLL